MPSDQERLACTDLLRAKVIQARAARRMGDEAGVELLHEEINKLLDHVLVSKTPA